MVERLEGFVAINRLTGGYLAHNVNRRKLVSHVKAKGRHGMWVDILGVKRDGTEFKTGGFMVEKR